MNNLNHDHLEEVNLLFELIKTILITELSQTMIKRYLKEYTHTEIRNGRYEDGVFIVEDLVGVKNIDSPYNNNVGRIETTKPSISAVTPRNRLIEKILKIYNFIFKKNEKK